MGATFNADDNELVFKNINQEALKDGPIESNSTKNNNETTPNNNNSASTTPADTVSLADYKRVNLVSQNGVTYLPTMVNDKDMVNWNLATNGRKIEITEAMAEQLLESGAIEKGDFEDGETFKTASGKKLRSNTFIIKKLQIGDVVLENVKVTISNKITEPTLGAMNTAFKKLNPVIKGSTLYMKPKERKSKPGEE